MTKYKVTSIFLGDVQQRTYTEKELKKVFNIGHLKNLVKQAIATGYARGISPYGEIYITREGK